MRKSETIDSTCEVIPKERIKKSDLLKMLQHNPIKKDKPTPPQKPKTPYLLWKERNKMTFLSILGNNAKSNEISSYAATQWKLVSKVERKPYKELSISSKIKYEAEMRKYNTQYSDTNHDIKVVIVKDSNGTEYYKDIHHNIYDPTDTDTNNIIGTYINQQIQLI